MFCHFYSCYTAWNFFLLLLLTRSIASVITMATISFCMQELRKCKKCSTYYNFLKTIKLILEQIQHLEISYYFSLLLPQSVKKTRSHFPDILLLYLPIVIFFIHNILYFVSTGNFIFIIHYKCIIGSRLGWVQEFCLNHLTRRDLKWKLCFPRIY